MFAQGTFIVMRLMEQTRLLSGAQVETWPLPLSRLGVCVGTLCLSFHQPENGIRNSCFYAWLCELVMVKI